MEDKNLYQQKILEILKGDPAMSKEFIDYCLLLLKLCDNSISFI